MNNHDRLDGIHHEITYHTLHAERLRSDLSDELRELGIDAKWSLCFHSFANQEPLITIVDIANYTKSIPQEDQASMTIGKLGMTHIKYGKYDPAEILAIIQVVNTWLLAKVVK